MTTYKNKKRDDGPRICWWWEWIGVTTMRLLKLWATLGGLGPCGPGKWNWRPRKRGKWWGIYPTSRIRPCFGVSDITHLLFFFSFSNRICKCCAERGLHVCVLGTRVSCAKTYELIEISFGGWLVWAQGTVYHTGMQIPTGTVTWKDLCLPW